MQMDAAQADAARSSDESRAAAHLAAEQLAAALAECDKLQHQLERQVADMASLQDASTQQAAQAAVTATDRLQQALADQRLQLQGSFNTQLSQQEAAAAGVLQKALDDACEHRHMLLAQAASERCCQLRLELSRAASCCHCKRVVVALLSHVLACEKTGMVA
jgi:hypothetical protein